MSAYAQGVRLLKEFTDPVLADVSESMILVEAHHCFVDLLLPLFGLDLFSPGTSRLGLKTKQVSRARICHAQQAIALPFGAS